MLYVATQNLLPILVGLLIGFITGLWIWKLARPKTRTERVLTEEPAMRRPYVENRPPPVPLSASELAPFAAPRPEPEVLARRGYAATPSPDASAGVDDLEDNDIASGAASAIEDVAGQFLGIDAHPSRSEPPGGPATAGDDLQIMKGVGPKLASLLRGEGITRFDQIAALRPEDLARLDAHLGAFKGRLARDRIVEQAALLSVGDRAGYERAFGKL